MLVPSGSMGVLVGSGGGAEGLEDGNIRLGGSVTMKDESVASSLYILINHAPG